MFVRCLYFYTMVFIFSIFWMVRRYSSNDSICRKTILLSNPDSNDNLLTCHILSPRQKRQRPVNFFPEFTLNNIASLEYGNIIINPPRIPSKKYFREQAKLKSYYHILLKQFQIL